MNTEPTTITITDPVLLKQLAETTGPIMFRDADGVPVRYADGQLWAPPPGFVPPISQEELQRRSETYRSGISTAEVMKRMRGEQ